MYNPRRFRSENVQEAFALMDSYPFATVVSIADGEPVISHLPLTPKWVDDQIELLGHLARANRHWRVLSESPTTAIFHGPHTFVTPTWYVENDVPTWNYSVVHATGRLKLIEDHNGIVECLKELTEHTERHWPSGWEFFIPDDLQDDKLTKNIVGFRMQIDTITFKKKLSQNRSLADQIGIMEGLEARTDDNSRAILVEMRKQAQKPS